MKSGWKEGQAVTRSRTRPVHLSRRGGQGNLCNQASSGSGASRGTQPQSHPPCTVYVRPAGEVAAHAVKRAIECAVPGEGWLHW